MSAAKSAVLLMLALSPGSVIAADVSETPEEIVVTGRLPGPPLWRVSNGDKVLWIFPYLNWVPRDMLWDSARVARVIAQSQEVLSLPESRVAPSALVLLNPINQVRGVRFVNRLERNPDGRTLEDNLPPELYARFAALQARYFPADKSFVDMRPWIAGDRMARIIRNREGLDAGNEVLKTIRRLVRRNRGIERTEISVAVTMEGGYREVTNRMKATWESYPPELERACFEQQVRHIEEDLDAMKRRANSWAQGYIAAFRDVPLVFDQANSCDDLFIGSSSPARERREDMAASLDRLWLDAADNALMTNASTFAILPIDELLAEDGLLSKLAARGYEVSAP